MRTNPLAAVLLAFSLGILTVSFALTADRHIDVGRMLSKAGRAIIPRAEAAERFLGVIINQDAGSVHNLFPLDGGAFGIPQAALITVQSNFDSYVCVSDVTANGVINPCTSTRGVQVPSGTAFPSACAANQRIKVEDGGWITDSCIVNVKSVSATGGGNTVIWERNGKEF